jgi:UDP-N-acetylglucosamine--N-acetylmuramyl-(pentapeptide) pyrophosphoryl-undecaprenol N-acetylglucosamine transferase
MESETFAFAGGGSGGHLFPGIAVADELQQRNPAARSLFLGSERPLEAAILRGTRYPHHALPVLPLQSLRRAPVSFIRQNWSACREARRILLAKRPRWVIGLGGFISAPAVWAAWRLGIPVLLLEQNVIPGAATRWLSRFARQICLPYDETRAKIRSGRLAIVTGNPLRHDIVAAAERAPFRKDTSGRPTLLILGGSQGAESLNEAVLRLGPEISSALTSWNVAHQTGAGRSSSIRARWLEIGIDAVVEDFFPNMVDRYLDADLVISRAGATTLAELACFGRPSLLLPYPFAAEQHQAANAELFSQQGAALTIAQAATPAETADRLRAPLSELLVDSRRRAAMGSAARQLARPDAAHVVADLLLQQPAANRVLRPATAATPA